MVIWKVTLCSYVISTIIAFLYVVIFAYNPLSFLSNNKLDNDFSVKKTLFGFTFFSYLLFALVLSVQDVFFFFMADVAVETTLLKKHCTISWQLKNMHCMLCVM